MPCYDFSSQSSLKAIGCGGTRLSEIDVVVDVKARQLLREYAWDVVAVEGLSVRSGADRISKIVEFRWQMLWYLANRGMQSFA